MLDKKKKKKGHNLRLIERRLQDRSSRVTRRNVYKDVYKKKNSNWKIILRSRLPLAKKPSRFIGNRRRSDDYARRTRITGGREIQ